MKCILAITLLFATSFFPTTGFAEADRAEIEAIVKEYIEKHPDIIINSVRKYDAKLKEAQKKAQFQQSFNTRVDVSIDKAPVKGPDNAKITVFEFSDFQCPYCGRSQATINQLYKKYEGNIRFVFKHLPLNIHAKAKPAARAAMAAGEQGKFWEYKSKLMTNMQNWSRGNEKELFIQYAKELKLDIKKFKEDQQKENFGKIIDDDMALAQKIGARATPTFVINGVVVRGAQPLQHFEKVIEKILNEG